MVLIQYFTRLLVFSIACSCLFWSLGARSETMFEGYYNIKSGNKPVGFVIQRYSFDQKKKLFISTYYIKTNQMGGNITESLHAVANDKFEPISYQYTSKTAGKIKTIDAGFKGNKMKAVISNDGKQGQVVEKVLPKGSFLSTFLAYMMLSKGISKGKKFTYSAVAEEDGELFSGQALIQKPEAVSGIDAFRVLNEFKGAKFISLMTPKGEVLGTTSPVQMVSTELQLTPAKATTGFQLDTKSLRLLFGDIPRGQKNILAAQKNDSNPPIQNKTNDSKKKPASL